MIIDTADGVRERLKMHTELSNQVHARNLTDTSTRIDYPHMLGSSLNFFLI